MGTSGHRDKARDKVTSPQGWHRKLKQHTIKSYINLKFKMAGWDLQGICEGISSIQACFPCDLGAGSPFAHLGGGLTVLPCIWVVTWELPENLQVLQG